MRFCHLTLGVRCGHTLSLMIGALLNIDFGSSGVEVSAVEHVDESDVAVPPSVRYPIHTSTNAALWHELIPMSSSVTGVRYTMYAGSMRLAHITQCNQPGLQLGISVPKEKCQFR